MRCFSGRVAAILTISVLSACGGGEEPFDSSFPPPPLPPVVTPSPAPTKVPAKPRPPAPVKTPPTPQLPETNGLPFAGPGVTNGGDIRIALAAGPATVTAAQGRDGDRFSPLVVNHIPLTIAQNATDQITITIDGQPVTLTRGIDDIYRNGQVSFAFPSRDFGAGKDVSVYSMVDLASNRAAIMAIGNETDPTPTSLRGAATYDVDLMGIVRRSVGVDPATVVVMDGTGSINLPFASLLDGKFTVDWRDLNDESVVASTTYDLRGNLTGNRVTANLRPQNCIGNCESRLEGNLFGVDGSEIAGTGVIQETIVQQGQIASHTGTFGFLGTKN